MDLSIFLAKALGIYLVIISVGMLIHGGKLKAVMADYIEKPGLVFLLGIFALIIGILLVVSHNIWTGDWRVVITVIGWLTLVKGITRVLFPQFVIRTGKKWVNNTTAYYITGFLTLLIGIYLLYHGYYVTQY